VDYYQTALACKAAIETLTDQRWDDLPEGPTLFRERIEMRKSSLIEGSLELLRELNKTGARKMPDDAPRSAVTTRGRARLFTPPLPVIAN
jgi:hypothetical protein